MMDSVQSVTLGTKTGMMIESDEYEGVSIDE